MTEFTDIKYVPWDSYRSQITDIKVEYGVLSLGRFSFYKMPNLKTVSLPASVKEIGMQAFFRSPVLEKVDFPGAMVIGELAFSDCAALKEVTLPESMLKVKKRAFYDCPSLTKLKIHRKARIRFEDDAFCKTALKEADLGSTAVLIGDNAFGYTYDGMLYTPVSGFKVYGVPATQAEYYAKAKGLAFIPDMTGLSVSLAKNVYAYTGSAIKPAVTIKNGDIPLAPESYNVKYESNKDVGTAKVTVTAKGAGKGSVSASFRIIPKKTPISKLTAKSKGFTAKWKKIGGCADGYQIQAALNKTFTSGVKTVTVKGAGTVSKTVNGLKAKTKYFVRIRVYKTVKGAKVWSEWSAAKTVKTK